MDAWEAKEIGPLLKRFQVNCAQLELDSGIQQSAFDTYQRLAVDGGLARSGDDAQGWLCCAVYSELQLAKIRDIKGEFQETGNRCWNMSLTRLLRCFKVSGSVFLRCMEHWNWLAQNTKVLQLEVEELRRRFSVTLILLQHYKSIFQSLFTQPSEDEDALAFYHSLYEFGWLLFLVVRNELPGFATENLVNGCQVLVCSMDLLYVNMLEVPNSPVIRRDFPRLPSMWGTKYFDSDILKKYSALQAIGALLPHLPERGVQQMKNAFFQKALMVLFMDQTLLGNDTHMREILKEGMLDVNLATLNRKYSSHVADISEMDERVLLCCQDAKERNKSSPDSKSSPRPASSPYKKLLDHKLPQSMPPIIKALGEGENYDTIVHPVEKLLIRLGHTFSSAVKDHMNEEVAAERFHLARGLFYKFLQKILASELALKPQLKLGSLLKQYTLTTALIACCLEVALHIHDEQVDQVRFPFVLDCYSLNVYDFQKILELVVRHDEGLLGRVLVRHLHTVEDQCLGTLIFRDNSQLWQHFGKNDRLPSYQEVQTQAEDKENPSTGAGICLRKFYALAHRRLLGLCKRLSLVDAYPRIWHLAEYSFTLKGGELLRQRNLDLLLLCAIHLHARLEDLRLSFSEIIQEYRRQPHAQSSVYRQVSLGNGQTVDIIRFYNTTFVRSMARYGLHLRCEQSTPPKSLSPFRKNVTVLMETVPNELRMRGNISVSSPPPPKICLSGSCSSLDLTESINRSPRVIIKEENLNLKRSVSSNEIHADKQPNILRRRTCFH
ncbi:retinoblastoma family protein [Drosophila kikkawai]|uniref:Retinoblastoma family protein n=1 Tax=Drosophila kikkawai TaxID=30033 RepID=A0A6P4J7X2_DROKI|nr:retinoblastoma family protein [Drosophila kikkawai]